MRNIDINSVEESLNNASEIWFHQIKENSPTIVKLGFDGMEGTESYFDLLKLNRGNNPMLVLWLDSSDKLALEILNSENRVSIKINDLSYDKRNLQEFKDYQKHNQAFGLIVGENPAFEMTALLPEDKSLLNCNDFNVQGPLTED